MTGPAREDFNEEPDFDLPEEPAEKPKRDAWDDEEGVPVDVEDIAIVCHEALRAYRSTQGGRPGFPWMHQTTAERADMVKAVQAIQRGQIDPAEPSPSAVFGDDTEPRLLAAIVKALKS
jgi:hypothetical protein